MASEPSDRGDGDGRPETDGGLDAELDRAVPASDAEAFLISVGGQQAGRVYALHHNTVFLGRAPEADVFIANPSVSARHARIINGSHGFEIEDLDSTNGTFVGGKRITRARLRGGDRVTLGQVDFNFLLDRPIEATIAVLPPRQPRVNVADGGALVPIPAPYYPPPHFPATGRLLNPEEEKGPSLAEFVAKVVRAYLFIRRHLVLIGVLAGLGAGVGVLSLAVIPPSREALCQVRLLPNVKSNPMDPQQGRPYEDALQFFAGAERAFTDGELVASTLKKLLGREPDDSHVAAVVGRLRFEPLPDHVYRATYRDRLLGGGKPAPMEFLTAHLENYVEVEIGKALRVFTAQADFLRDQMKSVEAEMSRISAEKVQFREKNSDRLPEEAALTHNSRFTLETKKAELTAQIRQVQGELEAQRRALKSEGPLAQTKFSGSQAYRDSLARINGKLSEGYARGLADGHPEIKQLKDEKQRIEALIQKEMASDTNELDRRSNAGYQAIQTRIELLQAQLNAARGDLADTERDLAQVRHVVGDLPRVEARVQQLNDTQESTTRLHAQLFEQLKKADLQLSLERVSAESRYEIIVPPQLVAKKTALTVGLRAAIGLILGLFVAALVIGLGEVKRMFSKAMRDLDGELSTTR